MSDKKLDRKDFIVVRPPDPPRCDICGSWVIGGKCLYSSNGDHWEVNGMKERNAVGA